MAGLCRGASRTGRLINPADNPLKDPEILSKGWGPPHSSTPELHSRLHFQLEPAAYFSPKTVNLILGRDSGLGVGADFKSSESVRNLFNYRASFGQWPP